MVIAAVALVLAACDSPPPEEAVPEPETVETCDGLVDVGVQLVRAYVHVLEELPVSAVVDEDLPELVELDRLGRDLDGRVTGLGCDPAALNGDIATELADIETDSPAAGMVLDIVGSGLVTDTTDPPPTTGDPTSTGATEAPPTTG